MQRVVDCTEQKLKKKTQKVEEKIFAIKSDGKNVDCKGERIATIRKVKRKLDSHKSKNAEVSIRSLARSLGYNFSLFIIFILPKSKPNR